VNFHSVYVLMQRHKIRNKLVQSEIVGLRNIARNHLAILSVAVGKQENVRLTTVRHVGGYLCRLFISIHKLYLHNTNN